MGPVARLTAVNNEKATRWGWLNFYEFGALWFMSGWPPTRYKQYSRYLQIVNSLDKDSRIANGNMYARLETWAAERGRIERLFIPQTWRKS
jgi:hypothetical protein